MKLKKFTEFIREIYKYDDVPIFRGGQHFQITYGELSSILTEITDEFPELSWSAENSLQSSLIEEDANSFVIIFCGPGSMWELPTLYYLEPKIWNLIENVNSQLAAYDLYVSDSDFGESDVYYELVISKTGHEPVLRARYEKTIENSAASATTAGSGAVTSASVSSTSVSSSVSGSGDITNTLKVKHRRKRGNPSQVSDLRDLAPAKINRVSF